jgi:hypothetical protein
MTDAAALVDVINKALNDFRGGDITAFTAAWMPRGVEIVDDVPPYQWTGEGALQRWLSDTSKHIAGLDLADLDIRSKPALHAEVSGDNGYVILPVVVTYKRAGRRYIQEGTQVLVMNKTEKGWKMRTMSYAAPPAVPRE